MLIDVALLLLLVTLQVKGVDGPSNGVENLLNWIK